MTLNGILDQLIFSTLIIISMLIYSKPLKVRRNGILYFLLSLVGITGFVLLFAFFGDAGILHNINNSLRKNLQELLLMALCILTLPALKKTIPGNLLFIGYTSIATANCIVNIYSFLSAFLFGPKGIITPDYQAVSIILRLSAMLLSAVLFLLFCRYRLADYFFKNGFKMFQYSIDHSIIVFYVAALIINMFLGGDFDTIDTMTYQYILLCRIAFNMLALFYVFQQANYISAKVENTKMAYIMETQQKQYEEAKKNADAINVKAHDIKHFIEIFRNGTIMSENARKELEELSQNYDTVFDTGRQALDITLKEKCRNYTSSGIDYSVMADGNALALMTDVDIYTLFGNLLDNGYEAMMLCTSVKDRIMTLSLKQNENFIMLHMENSCSRPPLFQNGIPVSVKNDNINHGYGIKSIRSIVEKYSGNLTMRYEEGMFIVDILFQK